MKTKVSKAEHILGKIQEYIGGDLVISKRGVPHLVINDYYSICYFATDKFLRVFSGYKTPNNQKYGDFKTYPELVRHFHFVLGYSWVGTWYLDRKED